MTLHELQRLCEEKARLIDDPNVPSVMFVLVMVHLKPDDSAHIATATTCDARDTRHALHCALEMEKAKHPPAPVPKPKEQLS